MLSVEGPSGPTCSSYQVSSLKSEERSLASRDGETFCLRQDKVTQFSIRDYVFASRKKNVETNWPFPQRYLQLCLKHGIHVVLPPFEPPNSVRSLRYSNKKGHKELPVCLGRDPPGVEQDKIIPKEASCSFNSERNSPNHHSHQSSLICGAAIEGDKHSLEIAETADRVNSGQVVVASVVTTSYSSLEQSNPYQPIQLENERIIEGSEVSRSQLPCKVASLKEPAGKKYRLIVKLGTNPEFKRVDEVSSNSSMVSDPMASKVCPVCKMFTSSSNTTLNAHIDQCLSIDSNMNKLASIPFKHKMKPTKKRLMVDIYRTAPCCTLEDLDRRNGTSWASDSAAAQPSAREACIENKKQKCSVVDQADEKADKGAVYIDSSGTKICILSKLDAVTGSRLDESSDHNSKKFFKHSNQLPKLKLKRKRHFAPRTTMLVKSRTLRKKENIFGLLRDQIREVSLPKILPEAADGEAHHQSIMASQKQMRSKVSGALRHLFSSKNSIALKQLSFPVEDDCSKHSTIRKMLMKTNHYHPMRSSTRKCHIAPRHKSTNKLSNAPSVEDCRDKQPKCILDYECNHVRDEFSSGGDLTMKMQPKSARTLVCFPKIKSIDQDSHFQRPPINYSSPPFDSCQSSRCDMEVVDGHLMSEKSKERQLQPSSMLCKYMNKRKLIVKRFQKRRSLRTCKKVEESFPNSNEFLHSSNHVTLPVDGVDFEARRITRKDTSNHDASLHLNMGVSKDGRSADGHPGTGALDPTVVMNSTSHGSADPPITSGNLTSEGLFATSDSCLKSWMRLVENNSFIPGKEVWADAHDPRSYGLQTLHPVDLMGNAVSISDDLVAAKNDIVAAENSHQAKIYMECKTNAQQVLGSSTCQSSSVNTGAELPRGNSSVTSALFSWHDDHNRSIGTMSCESPVSGTSNVSHPLREELKEQALEPVVEDSRRMVVSPEAWGSYMLPRKPNEDVQNQVVLRSTLGQPQETHWCGQQCCCSRGQGMESHMLSLGEKTISTCGHERSVTESAAISVLASISYNSSRCVHLEESTPRCAGSSLQIEQNMRPGPVLRLMGKDVVIQEYQNVPCSSSTPSSSGHYFPFHPIQSMDVNAPLSSNGNSCDDCYFMQGQELAQMPPLHTTRMPCFVNTSVRHTQHARQNRSGWSLQFGCNLEKGYTRQFPRPSYDLHYETKDTIAVDHLELDNEADAGQPSPASTISSNVEAQSFRGVSRLSCLGSQYPYSSVGFLGKPKLELTNIRPGNRMSSPSGQSSNPRPMPFFPS